MNVKPSSIASGYSDARNLALWVTRHGGHCGYLKNWKLHSWAEDRIAERFLQGVGAS